MFLILAGLLLTGICSRAVAWAADPVRVGYFANITHAQALVGKANGEYERRLGTKVEWKAFNAGPSAMEALLAGALDITFVGPNPAVNAYLRSKGKALTIIAGAAGGGACLVVRPEAGIRSPADFRGKRIASPEFGNTQDVALRHWLKSNGLTPGKDVQVLPTKNPDILMLFQQKQLAAAWVPEPWVARLVQEGGGRIFLDERSLWPGGQFTTAVVVARSDFLQRNRPLVRKFLEAHVDVTRGINQKPAEAKRIINEELARTVRKPLPTAVLDDAFGRLTITYDPLSQPLLVAARHAADLGLLPAAAAQQRELTALFDLALLNEVLKARRLPSVR
jgi:NitT/TauT family transport system substrate-binding protein